MNVRSFAPRAVAAAVGLAMCSLGHASTTTYSGVFTADNSVFTNAFTTTSGQNYTFTTTSGASGNFLPVLTLYNSGTGSVVDFTNDSGFTNGMYDVSLSDTLDAGSYLLALTEFPNVASGNLTDGFLFGSDPTATGDYCGGSLTGQNFVNAESCSSATQLGKNYSLDATSNAVATTPEPSSFLLMLAPAAALIEVARRRRFVA